MDISSVVILVPLSSRQAYSHFVSLRYAETVLPVYFLNASITTGGEKLLISYTSAALQVMYSGERIFSSMFSNHSGQSIFCVSFELFIIEIKSDAVEHITLAAFSYPSLMSLFMRLAREEKYACSSVESAAVSGFCDSNVSGSIPRAEQIS